MNTCWLCWSISVFPCTIAHALPAQAAFEYVKVQAQALTALKSTIEYNYDAQLHLLCLLRLCFNTLRCKYEAALIELERSIISFSTNYTIFATQA